MVGCFKTILKHSKWEFFAEHSKVVYLPYCQKTTFKSDEHGKTILKVGASFLQENL
jgi:hypothetical protein